MTKIKIFSGLKILNIVEEIDIFSIKNGIKYGDVFIKEKENNFVLIISEWKENCTS